jgi:hypothetical protein
MSGDSIDTPQVANLTKPTPTLTINGMTVDMAKFVEASKQLGVAKGDVLSIRGHRNSHGAWVPDYDSIRIEKRGQSND